MYKVNMLSSFFKSHLAKFFPIFWCGSPLYDKNWRQLTKLITFDLSSTK